MTAPPGHDTEQSCALFDIVDALEGALKDAEPTLEPVTSRA